MESTYSIVGFVQKSVATALVPKLLKHKLQKRQIARLIPNIVENAPDQSCFEFQLDFLRRLADCALKFFTCHGTQVDLGTLQSIAQRPISQGFSHEVAAQG